MARFVNANTLRDAVRRLGGSRAKSSLSDYLVFKRALVLTRKTDPSALAVTTGTESDAFQRAIKEVASATSNGAQVWTGQPFFSPFGQRDSARGFKGPKYVTNGPSDTVGRWQSQGTTPLRVVPATSPKQFTFEARTSAELANFFLLKSGTMPTLLDAALWWHRFADLDAQFGHAPTQKEITDAFAGALDLNAAELSGLFVGLTVQEASQPAGTFDAAVAEPSEYLPASVAPSTKSVRPPPLDLESKVDQVRAFIEAHGFIFAPWQIAAFVTAVRTKPFVILAGISGTGKTKLPRLVAEATGSVLDAIPVRPDWTDGSDLIGYERLDGKFIPGRLLQLAERAQREPTNQFFALLDEMNIARVEYYLADVLSHIEERQRDGTDLKSKPLAPNAPAPWNSVCLPSNLCVVGSVNMDETTHGFSRKVLVRAFVIEFSDIDLSQLGSAPRDVEANLWAASDWRQQQLTLAEHPDRSGPIVSDVITVLSAVNQALEHAQLQVGYRVRDEIALFCLNAQGCPSSFRALDAGAVDTLDLAIAMKILPRIQGGGAPLDAVLGGLAEWAATTTSPSGALRAFPFCQERIALMRERLKGGFTSFWL